MGWDSHSLAHAPGAHSGTGARAGGHGCVLLRVGREARGIAHVHALHLHPVALGH